MQRGRGAVVSMEGKRFGALVVLRRAPRTHSNADWICRCDCGTECIKIGWKLRQNHIKSCGQNGCSWWKFAPPGKTRTYAKEYQAWERMRRRCSAKLGTKSHKNYVARGITVCERWQNSFENFLADMGPRPSPKHSLDRYPDNNGNYEPTNCRWATAKEQARNTRESLYVIHNGEKILFMALVDQLNLDRGIVYGRLKSGWSLEEALAIPVNRHKKKRRLTKRNTTE